METKQNKSSILKPIKPRNPLTDLNLQEPMGETPIEIVTARRISMRRVSFACSTYIKEFVTDPEKNTIWNTTYEEIVNKSDPTNSMDEINNPCNKQSNKSTIINEEHDQNLPRKQEVTHSNNEQLNTQSSSNMFDRTGEHLLTDSGRTRKESIDMSLTSPNIIVDSNNLDNIPYTAQSNTFCNMNSDNCNTKNNTIVDNVIMDLTSLTSTNKKDEFFASNTTMSNQQENIDMSFTTNFDSNIIINMDPVGGIHDKGDTSFTSQVDVDIDKNHPSMMEMEVTHFSPSKQKYKFESENTINGINNEKCIMDMSLTEILSPNILINKKNIMPTATTDSVFISPFHTNCPSPDDFNVKNFTVCESSEMEVTTFSTLKQESEFDKGKPPSINNTKDNMNMSLTNINDDLVISFKESNIAANLELSVDLDISQVPDVAGNDHVEQKFTHLSSSKLTNKSSNGNLGGNNGMHNIDMSLSVHVTDIIFNREAVSGKEVLSHSHENFVLDPHQVAIKNPKSGLDVENVTDRNHGNILKEQSIDNVKFELTNLSLVEHKETETMDMSFTDHVNPRIMFNKENITPTISHDSVNFAEGSKNLNKTDTMNFQEIENENTDMSFTLQLSLGAINKSTNEREVPSTNVIMKHGELENVNTKLTHYTDISHHEFTNFSGKKPHINLVNDVSMQDVIHSKNKYVTNNEDGNYKDIDVVTTLTSNVNESSCKQSQRQSIKMNNINTDQHLVKNITSNNDKKHFVNDPNPVLSKSDDQLKTELSCEDKMARINNITPKKFEPSFCMPITPYSPFNDDTQHLINYSLNHNQPNSDFSKIITGDLNPSFLSAKFLPLSEFGSDVFAVSFETSSHKQMLCEHENTSKEKCTCAIDTLIDEINHENNPLSISTYADENKNKEELCGSTNYELIEADATNREISSNMTNKLKRKSNEMINNEVESKKSLLQNSEHQITDLFDKRDYVESMNISQSVIHLESVNNSLESISEGKKLELTDITDQIISSGNIQYSSAEKFDSSFKFKTNINTTQNSAGVRLKIENFTKKLLQQSNTFTKQADLRKIQYGEMLKLISRPFKQNSVEEIKSSSICNSTDTTLSGSDCANGTQVQNRLFHINSNEIPSNLRKILTLKEEIEQKQKSCKRFWTLLCILDNKCEFDTLFKSIKVQVQLCQEGGIVNRIDVQSLLLEESQPVAKYVHKMYMKCFSQKAIHSAVGEYYDILTLLDYVSINMEKMFEILDEFNMLAKHYNLVMDQNFAVTFKVINLQLQIVWYVSVDMADIDNITENSIKAFAKIGSVKEVEIQRIVPSCPQGTKFLRSFISNIFGYIDVLKKKEELKAIHRM